MIFNTEKHRIIKEAKRKAKQEYIKTVKLEKAKKNFLENPDDFNFYAELLKGLQVDSRLKIIVEKSNGTKVILRISEEEEKTNRISDWIDFETITTSQNEVRIK